jgi:hypothetical protein
MNDDAASSEPEITTPVASTTSPLTREETCEPAAPRSSGETGPVSPAEPRSADAGEMPLPPTSTRSLAVVLRALARHQARSTMLERLAEVALEEFYGAEGRPPTKLLRLPNGLRYAIEPDDSLELHLELLRSAGEERFQMQAIHAAAVQIAPEAVDIPSVPYVAGVSGPPDEYASAVDNPGHPRGPGPSTNLGVNSRARAAPSPSAATK